MYDDNSDDGTGCLILGIIFVIITAWFKFLNDVWGSILFTVITLIFIGIIYLLCPRK